MLDYFDLGQEKGSALVEVIKQMFGLGVGSEETWYDTNTGNLGVSAGNAAEYVK